MNVTVTKRTLIEGHEIVTERYSTQTLNDSWLDAPHSPAPDFGPVVGTRRAIRADLDNGAVILWPLVGPEPTDDELLAFAIETKAT